MTCLRRYRLWLPSRISAIGACAEWLRNGAEVIVGLRDRAADENELRLASFSRVFDQAIQQRSSLGARHEPSTRDDTGQRMAQDTLLPCRHW